MEVNHVTEINEQLSLFPDYDPNNEEFVVVEFNSNWLNFIFDFFQKAIAVKVTGSVNSNVFVDFSPFKAVKTLELFRVPVETIRNVSFLKKKVSTLVLQRCCTEIMDFITNGDMSEEWKKLTRANFRFNTISTLNDKLHIAAPYLKFLDLSHNNIRHLGKSLLYLNFLETLKISYNKLEDIPDINPMNFKNFIAKSNNIKMVDGFTHLYKLERIDLTSNCLEYLEQLTPLNQLSKLKRFNVYGNPLQFQPHYRRGILKELNHNINADLFQLDGDRVTLQEYNYLKMQVTADITDAIQSSYASLGSSGSSDSDHNISRKYNRSPSPIKSLSRSTSTKRITKIVETSSVPINVRPVGSEVEAARSLHGKYGDDWIHYYEDHNNPGNNGGNTVNFETAQLTLDDLNAITQIIAPDELTPESTPTDSLNFSMPSSAVNTPDQGSPITAQTPTQENGLEKPGDTEPNADAPEQHIDLTDTLEAPVVEIPSPEPDLYETNDDTSSDQPESPTELSSVQYLVNRMDSNESYTEVFVSVDNETVVERNTDCVVVEEMDIKALTNFNDKELLLVLEFDHIKVSRRKREYNFETIQELREFENLIEPIWRNFRETESKKQKVKCLNCDKVMDQAEIEGCCPYCGSNILTEMLPLPDTPPPSSPPEAVAPFKWDVPSTPLTSLLSNLMPGTTSSPGRDLGEDKPPSQGSPDNLEVQDVDDENKSSHTGGTKSIADTESLFETGSVTSISTGNNTIALMAQQDNFVQADHNLELYFQIKLFIRENEVKHCYLNTKCIPWNRKEMNTLLVVSNYYIYICKIVPGTTTEERCVLRSRHRLSKLRYLDIGLGQQHFRLEWQTEGASYKFLVGDTKKCQSFVAVLKLALSPSVQISYTTSSTEDAIRQLVFGIDKTYELRARAKMFHRTFTNTEESWGIQDRTVMFKTFPKCFLGQDMVTWLVNEGIFDSRAAAVNICQQMLMSDLLHHVKLEYQFQDSTLLFRFTVDEEGEVVAPEQVSSLQDTNRDIQCYQLAYYNENNGLKPVSLVISNVDIFIANENHQWPIPRLQPTLPLERRGQHFDLISKIMITDVSSLTVSNNTVVVDVIQDDVPSYELQLLSSSSVNSFVDILSESWSKEFGFPIEVKQL